MSHKPLRRSSCHVFSETNMASSNHSKNDPASIQSIASTTISHIQQLVSLVEQRPTAASTSSNELQVATPRAGTALEELRRRFPTVSARSSRNAMVGHLFQNYDTIYVRYFPRILAIIPATRYTCFFLSRILAFFPALWGFYSQVYDHFLTNAHIYAHKKAHIYALQTSMWYMGLQKVVV